MPTATTSAAAFHHLLLLSFALRLLSSTSTTIHPRRILHQPLLPQDSSPPPAPSPPTLPFTTSSPGNSPFFQSYPSPPPPPSPASFATFPANISSLTVPAPRPSKPNSNSSKFIIAAVAAAVAAIAVASLAVFLHLRRRRSPSFNQSKSQVSNSGGAVSFNQAPNSRRVPKLRRPSQSSSEFLYLGTLVNSHAPGGGAAAASTINYSDDENSRKFDSPELRPLPPLITQRREFGSNAEVISSRDDESEKFYSPKGSINDRESSFGAGSASRRAFAAVEVENFNGSISNSSSTYSASFNLSPANNPRPIDSMSKSPDLIEIQTVAPLPPPEARVTLLRESASPSPPSSSSPERNSRSEESSPRNSTVLDQNLEYPALINNLVHNTTANPAPTETRCLELPACGSPLLESSAMNYNASDRDVESIARSSSAIELNLRNSNDIPASPELRSSEFLEYPPPLPPSSSPRNSNISDQYLVSDNSALEHTIPTPPELQGLVLPGSASPLPVSSPSPRNSSVSDQLAESPLRSDSTGVPPPPEIETFVLPESGSPFPPNSDVLEWNSESPARYNNSYAQQNSIGIPTAPENQPDVSDHNVEYSVGISIPERHNSTEIPTSPQMDCEESSPRNSNVSDQNVESPARINRQAPPSQEMEALALQRYSKNEETSPRNSNASDQDVESTTSSPVRNFTVVWYYPTPPEIQDMALSSPERHSTRYDESSPRISNASDQNAASPVRISSPEQPSPSSPERLWRETEESSSESFCDQNMEPPSSNAIPPPPPPPPPSKACPSPRTPTPAAKTPSEPPALINPLKPISFDSPTLISPMQLPCEDGESSSPPKPKLKPLHWDKVGASSDREMVWDQLNCSSFKLNEEMIETLFVVHTPKPNPNPNPNPGLDDGDEVLDPRKAQNIAILLKALHVTVDEVCEGLLEGNADILGTELLESLMKMAPTEEEERKLKECRDDSQMKLGPADIFLKAVVDVPHAFKRVEALLFVSNFESEVDYLKNSFATLEAACEELRASRMFLKLLETGNRMNVGTDRGDAHAFKLDTLLKLVDVKGADGKTTLLHFVVQEMIRSEGARLTFSGEHDDAKCRKLGLQVVSGLSSELSNVKKAAAMDAEVLGSYVSKLAGGIVNVKEIAELNSNSSSSKFSECMTGFTTKAEEEICRIQAQERLALSLVKEITEYFHGNSAMEEPHPFKIFTVVRDFLAVLDRVCKDFQMINERTIVSSAHKFPVPVNPMLLQQGGFQRRLQTSSDDESLPG